ncbi:hypothetical protein HZB07_03015 [Candidatus Saganbacteria bacterium]|nr:hypothetical protein [Candidatus Saganbacteria bacterium]
MLKPFFILSYLPVELIDNLKDHAHNYYALIFSAPITLILDFMMVLA